MRLIDRLRLGANQSEVARYALADVVAATRSRDGYLRQAAMLELSTRKSADAVEAIVERLNDWVAEVRIAAQNALAVYLTEPYFEWWVKALPTVQRLLLQGREAHEATVEQIEAFLVSHGLTSWLTKAGPASSQSVEALAYDIAIRRDAENRPALRDYGIASRNPKVGRSLLKSLGDELLSDLELRGSCLNSRSVELRLAAVRSIGTTKPPEDWLLLKNAFGDRSPAVSSAAWFFLERSGVDSKDLVDATLAGMRPNSKEYLLAICDFSARYGYQLDTQTLEVGVGHPNSRVRTASLETVVRLNKDRSDEIGRIALDDPCSRVQRVAVRLASAGLFDFGIDESADLLKQRPSAQLSNTLIQLSACQSRWAELIFLLVSQDLRASISPSDVARHESEWLRKSNSLVTDPTETHRKQIIELIARRPIGRSGAEALHWAMVFKAHGIE